jgi:thiol-disulfide isomerase/thioredoxin
MSVSAYHFSSPTCAPCKAIKPAVDDLKEEFTQITWVSVNTHVDKEGFATKYGVSVVPTIVVESKDANGVVISVEKHSGIAIAGYYRILRNGLRLTQQS